MRSGGGETAAARSSGEGSGRLDWAEGKRRRCAPAVGGRGRLDPQRGDDGGALRRWEAAAARCGGREVATTRGGGREAATARCRAREGIGEVGDRGRKKVGGGGQGLTFFFTPDRFVSLVARRACTGLEGLYMGSCAE